jgi:hypothetical protein
MENNETIIRSVSIPLLQFRVAQKRNISLSKALRNGIAIQLCIDEMRGATEPLSPFEEMLITDSPIGELKRITVEKVMERLK